MCQDITLFTSTVSPSEHSTSLQGHYSKLNAKIGVDTELVKCLHKPLIYSINNIYIYIYIYIYRECQKKKDIINI